MIDKATVQRITDTADIVDVVSDYVHLVRRGANYMGLCPFHNERTPSFSVNKRRNFCYCFSCKKGGSPVNFLMEKEGVSYRDALLMLAKKYGIEVHEKELTDEERRRQTEREAMLVANDWAATEMQKNLLETEEGRNVGLEYLYQRGVTDEAIKKFRLGYAIDRGNDLTDKARSKGFDMDVMTSLGLIGKSQEGRLYDRFRGRVIFPIINPSGNVMAFGGRDLKGGPAKYINSPESSLYKKSNELYGIFQAKGAIVKNDKCFLVEGYLDVIGMWQSGMENVVASSGTALTDGQIAVIHRFTDNITLLYDGDSAGIKAALRGIDMLLVHKINVKVLLLPDGHDPDSFARAHTPEEFRKYVEENETDIIRFKAKVLLDQAGNDPQKRYLAAKSVVTSLAHISDEIKRNIYVQECSSILGISEDVIINDIARVRVELKEKWRRERELRRIDSENPPSAGTTILTAGNSSPAASSSGETGNSADSVEATQTSAPASGRTAAKHNDLFYAVEKNVVEYVVRFGMSDFCSVVDENNEEYQLKVVEFIYDDLEADGITFSNPGLLKIFNKVMDMVPEFENEKARFLTTIEDTVAGKRRQGFDDISNRQLSMKDIRHAEKRLEESLEEFRQEEITRFSNDYAGNRLLNDEDSDIRIFATHTLSGGPTLSKIYARTGHTEDESQKLEVLVERALLEWKDLIINRKIEQLMQKMKTINENDSPEDMNTLLAEISKYHRIRSELGKTIGDRILKA